MTRKPIMITPQSIRSRFVALDAKDRKTIIAEGITAASVVRKAEKTGKKFAMMFIPKLGVNYCFRDA